MGTLNYYKILRHRQSRKAGRISSENYWTTYDVDSNEFETITGVKKFLKENYFYCKTRHPMYRDSKSGDPVKIGYIYSWKDQDRNDQGEAVTILCQDWLEIRKVKECYQTIII